MVGRGGLPVVEEEGLPVVEVSSRGGVMAEETWQPLWQHALSFLDTYRCVATLALINKVIGMRLLFIRSMASMSMAFVWIARRQTTTTK